MTLNDHLAPLVDRVGPLAPGGVSIVGTGPGAPDLITLKGAVRMSQADVLLHDLPDASPLWRIVPAHAERIFGGRRQGEPRPKPNFYVELLRPRVASGKRIVRLRNGDPLIFHRTEGEIAAYLDAGFNLEIVPGLTTATAAAGFAGVAPTLPGAADALVLTVGRGEGGAVPEAIDYAALAQAGTLALYIAEENASTIAKCLIDGGLPNSTPAMIVTHATRANQSCEATDLDSLSRRESLPIPSMLYVGGGVQGWERRHWIRRRPLHGVSVLNTRPIGQAATLTGALHALGAEVIEAPTVAIEPPDSFDSLDDALRRLPDCDWTLFASANGVEAVMRRLDAIGLDARALGRGKIAVVGPSTATALRQWGLRADLMPREFDSKSLADALIQSQISGKRVLAIRSDAGRDVLTGAIRSAGGEYDEVIAYRTTRPASLPETVIERLTRHSIHWATFTSPTTFRHFIELLGDAAADLLPTLKFASIGKGASAAMVNSGYNPHAEAQSPTADSLAQAIAAHSSQSPKGVQNRSN